MSLTDFIFWGLDATEEHEVNGNVETGRIVALVQTFFNETYTATTDLRFETTLDAGIAVWETYYCGVEEALRRAMVQMGMPSVHSPLSLSLSNRMSLASASALSGVSDVGDSTYVEVDQLKGAAGSASVVVPVVASSPCAWLPDKFANACLSCRVPFTFFNRRHHCRCCGYIFCGTCSSKV